MELSILVLFLLSGLFFFVLSRWYRDGVAGVCAGVLFVFAGLSVVADRILVFAGQNVTDAGVNLTYSSVFLPVGSSDFVAGFGLVLVLFGVYVGFLSAQLFGADDEEWGE